MKQSHEDTIKQYLDSFKVFEKNLNGESGQPIHKFRSEAIGRFAQLGFPTRSDEEWRFTNVNEIAQRHFRLPVHGALSAPEAVRAQHYIFENLKGPRLVFVNGIYSDKLSHSAELPPGMIVKPLSSALREDQKTVVKYLGKHVSPEINGFTALSAAFMRDGLFLHVPENVVMEDSIQVVFLTTDEEAGFVTYPRNLIIVGRHSQASIVESYISLANVSCLTNAVTEIVLGDEAVVEHDKFQNESMASYHIAATHIRQSNQSTYFSNSIALGGHLVRNDITALLDGERCECTLNGLSVGTGEQHIDNHTTIDHAKAHCASHELYKAVLDGSAKGVFNGKIFVRKDAQKTDAKQTNKTLLLSDSATIDTKPQLEIFADDVKCTHGATVGQLDEDQLFYLRARGIPELTARDILTFAFAGDVVSRINIGPLRDQLESYVHRKLNAGRVENGA